MEMATAVPLRLLEQETLVPAVHAHDAIARAETAERQVRALLISNRALMRALNDGVATGEARATFRAHAVVGKILQAANLSQLFGETPMLRFSRNADGIIDGIEVALLRRDDDDAPLYLHDAPVAFGGMAVVGGDLD